MTASKKLPLPRGVMLVAKQAFRSQGFNWN
jgi:hypothetical protein